MKRRDFVISTGLALMAQGSIKAMPESDIVTAGDLQKYLRSLSQVREPSVDRIITGDPGTRIIKAGTAWTPYFKTLKDAVNKGVNVMVVHEPTFYTHWDLDKKGQNYFNSPSPSNEQYLEAMETKRKWIEANGMVIIRSHDVPDIIKGFGIPFGLGIKLGFTNDQIIRSKDFYNVYRIEKDTAAAVAGKIAAKLRDYNQPGVAFYGDPERIVGTVGLGTGCICDPQQYAELEPDLVIAIDDTVRTWIQTTFAEDTGKPLVVINHGTSEEMGMRLLNQFLRKNVPRIEFLHFDQGCSYKWITA
jgi:putative NIF3 family GTP cyclohydrolase 1 type 2